MPQENSLEQRHEDEHIFLKAALLWHTQKLYKAAHKACTRTGAYDNGDAFKLDVLAVIEDAVQKLEQLQHCQPVSAACANVHCNAPFVCFKGDCVNPFTGEVVRPDRS